MQQHLKKVRIVISLAFLVLISFTLVDFNGIISPEASTGIMFLQFIPSMLKFITTLGIAAIGFIIVLALTSLFGRVYCSTICPLGTLQDVIIYLKNRFSKKKSRYKYSTPKTILRYSLLGLSIIALLFGLQIVISLLDPFSNFGRILTNLVQPLYLVSNNTLAAILNSMENYSLYHVKIILPHIISILFPLGVLIFILWMSIKHERLYCNTICPVGTFLGLISKVSIFKIRIEDSLCTSCMKCEVACKAHCLDLKNDHLDFSRCVGCFNCIDVCPNNGISYSLKKNDSSTEDSKRDFLKKSSTLALLLTGATKLFASAPSDTPKNKALVPVDKNFPVSPPGSKGLDHFVHSCTACHLCVSACPSKVLQPSLLEYGLQGFLQPHLDYHTAFCQYECTICSEVCPSGAILPITNSEKKEIQTGKVIFIKDNCIVKTDKTDCGACSEHCPTKAVDMVPYEEDLHIPETNVDICIGCGACEYACPAHPNKAIYVDGNYEHEVAQLPQIIEAQPEIIDDEEEFPF